jgi:hypothetical protein
MRLRLDWVPSRMGLPIDYALRPLYAWYGDMELVLHL